MWDCEHCGCQAIAGTLTFCPACFTPRPTEDVAAGSSSPDASSPPIAVGEGREIPQPHITDVDWGESDATH